MKIFEKIFSWFHRNSDNGLNVVLVSTKTNGKITNASVEYLVGGSFVNIKTFDNIEEATKFYNLLVA